MTEVVNEVLPGHPAGVLTGPNLAKEILEGAAAAVIAMATTTSPALQRVFRPACSACTSTTTSSAARSAAALKNVIAIAAGMARASGFGDNTKAAVITRGLAELTRLGVAMGGRPVDVRRAGRHGRPDGRGRLPRSAAPRDHGRDRLRVTGTAAPAPAGVGAAL